MPGAALPRSARARLGLGTRLGLVVLGAAGGVRRALEPSGPTDELLAAVPWLVAVDLVAVPVIVVAIVAAQRFNPLTAETWERPSWTGFPFSPRQPLQFLHAAAHALLAGGAGMLAALPWAPAGRALFALHVLATGVGAHGGTWASAQLFAAKLRPPREAED